MSTLRAALLLTVAVLSVGVLAQPRPRNELLRDPLLRRVADTSLDLRYAGVRSVQIRVGAELRTYRERVIRQGMRVRIEFPPGSLQSGQVMVEDARRRLQYNPATNEIRTLPARRDEVLGRVLRIPGATVKVTDGGVVAGIATRRAEIRDSQGRPLQRLWIDPARGAILKREALNNRGEVVAAYRFMALQYDPVVRPRAFEIVAPGARVITPIDDLRTLSRELGLRPWRLPEENGWALVGVRPLEGPGGSVLMQTYDNEDARVSLYVVRGEVSAERLRRLSEGDFNVTTWTRDGLTLALLGDLRPDELNRLAQRVRL